MMLSTSVISRAARGDDGDQDVIVPLLRSTVGEAHTTSRTDHRGHGGSDRQVLNLRDKEHRGRRSLEERREHFQPVEERGRGLTSRRDARGSSGDDDWLAPLTSDDELGRINPAGLTATRGVETPRLPLPSGGNSRSRGLDSSGAGVGSARLQRSSSAGSDIAAEDGAVRGDQPTAMRRASSAMAAAARVSARLVLASGPTANATAARRRQPADITRPAPVVQPEAATANGISRTEAAAGLHVARGATARNETGRSERRSSGRAANLRISRPGGRPDSGPVLGEPADIVDAEREIEGHADLAGGVGAAGVNDAEANPDGGAASSSSDEGGEPPAVTIDTAPPEIRRVLASSHNTIGLLLLLLCHYIITHLVSITYFVVGTVLLVCLDRRVRSHADVQVFKSRFILIGVAVSAALAIILSAVILSEYPAGDGLYRSLILAAPRPELNTVSDVMRSTIVVDLWARLLSVAVKALLTLLSGWDTSATRSGSGQAGQRCCSAAQYALCGRLRYCRRRLDTLREEGRDRSRLRASPRTDEERRAGDTSRGISSTDAGHSIRTPRFWTALCNVFFCLPRRVWAGSHRFRRGRSAVGNGSQRRAESDVGNAVRDSSEGEEGAGRRVGDGATLLSRAGRQRRVYAIVEMAFILYRCLLPVPAWMRFYGKDGEYFAAFYLVLKGMEVSLRTDRLARAACYVRRGDLDRGKYATPDEVAEAGSPDCSICYDRMDRPLLLPCQHLFCAECVAEWLERERACPLCRAEVPTSNPIPRSLRDGRTAVVPQIL